MSESQTWTIIIIRIVMPQRKWDDINYIVINLHTENN